MKSNIQLAVCFLVLGLSSFALSQYSSDNKDKRTVMTSQINKLQDDIKQEMSQKIFRPSASFESPENADRLSFPNNSVRIPNALVYASSCPNLTDTKPSATKGTFSFSDCIYAEFAAVIKTPQGYYPLAMPSPPDSNSSCSKLIVNFGPCASMALEIGSKDNRTYIKAITGMYRVNNDSEPIVFSNTDELFSVSDPNHYYKCNSEQPIAAKSMTKMYDPTTVLFTNFSLQAKKNLPKSGFVGVPEVCALDVTGSDWVTIAVGVCLVGLVAIVLAAYFVGRNRWYARSSYESV